MSDPIAALSKLSEAYDLAQGLFTGAITILLGTIGGAFWLGSRLEAAGKSSLIEKNSLLVEKFNIATNQYNDAKKLAEQASQDLVTLKAEIEELKARDPRVGRQLDASIEKAQESNSSLSDALNAATDFLSKLL